MIMKISKICFGSLSDGSQATLFTIASKRMSFSVTDFGCTITCVKLFDKKDSFTDVVLGFSSLSSYATSWGSFGAIIGRYSNKIENAQFSLGQKKYNLENNCGGHCLHGGIPRWENILWNSKIVQNEKSSGICFSKRFPDGFQGFPGNLDVEIEYLLCEDNSLEFNYRAVCDEKTPISITNHSYFNLKGSGSILDHILQLNCDKFLEQDKNQLPTGAIESVKNSRFDFIHPRRIGECKKIEDEKGYDNCFVTNAYRMSLGIPQRTVPLVKIATLTEAESKKSMEVFTNCEGFQLYNAKYVRYLPGKYGAMYMPFCGICFEPQAFPNSPNIKEFPSAILEPGQEYFSKTVFKFKF